MGVIKNTLKENYIFFIRELARLDEEIKALPPKWRKVIKDHMAEQFPESLPL